MVVVVVVVVPGADDTAIPDKELCERLLTGIHDGQLDWDAAMAFLEGAKEALDERLSEECSEEELCLLVMDDFRKAMRAPLTHTVNGKRKRYLKFKTEERNIAILDVDVVLREEPHLQKVYKYTPSKLLATLACKAKVVK